MSWLVDDIGRTIARWTGRSFERAARDPRAAQLERLKRLVHDRKDTAFGRDHGFASIDSPEAYRAAVPMRDYEGFRPYIDRIVMGEKRILTREEPFMFTTTSGTTDRPKLVPVTNSWRTELRQLVRVWLYRTMVDHPGLMRDGLVSLVSPAVEGYTEQGTPIGSVSGITYQKVPFYIQSTYVVPYGVMTIEDYDLRYLLATRYALARRASMCVAPNPSTFLRMAELGNRESESIIHAIHDGTLGIPETQQLSAHDREICAKLTADLKPNPAWAKSMEKARAVDGVLRPKDLWPNFKLVGCWLGGSCGVQANRLIDWYGDVAFRDPGFRATEATMTVPVRDSTAEGVLALNANFYEFIPVDEIESSDPPVLLADELEVGGQYYILLTTRGGLYRYDINDIIEVTGTYQNSPLVAFLRKGRDMVNITGEKLHVNQIYQAAQRASDLMDWKWEQLQLIPDAEAARYDLLLEPRDPNCPERALQAFVIAFDEQLSALNMEFAHKRKSKRLHLPRLHHMRQGWSTAHQRADVANGKRDGQYKWPYVRNEWHAISESFVLNTLDAMPPSEADTAD
ncbi:MAG: GH3 auxin-responsive promoter family protein [Myxococcota bacterium]